MPDVTDYCLVTTTVASEQDADVLANEIVTSKLAACVQRSNITSHYSWKDELHKGSEILLLIKTTTALYAKLEAFLAEHHKYEVPEIVRLPITAGAASYLNWINDVTSGPEE